MDVDKVNRWLMLIANFGVVIGLAVVIMELNHSTKLAETEAYIARTRTVGEDFSNLALSSDLAGILVRQRTEGLDSLSDEERLRLFGWELARMYRVAGQYHHFEQGYLEKEVIDNVLRLGAVPHVQLWRDLGITIEPPSFKAAIEEAEEIAR